MAKAFADLSLEDRILLQEFFYRTRPTTIAGRVGLRSGEQVIKRYRHLWRCDLDPKGILDGKCKSWLLRLWVKERKDLPDLVREGLPEKKFRNVSQGIRARVELFLAWFKQTCKRKG